MFYPSGFNKLPASCSSLQDDVLISDADLLVKQMTGQKQQEAEQFRWESFRGNYPLHIINYNGNELTK